MTVGFFEEPLKTYTIVSDARVQRRFYVDAVDEDEAFEIAAEIYTDDIGDGVYSSLDFEVSEGGPPYDGDPD